MSASAVTVLALASGMNAANPATIKIPTAKELLSTSVQPGQTQPDINPLATSGIQYQAMGVEHLIPLIPLILFGGVVIFVPLVFGGLVVIGEREVGIVVEKFALTGKGLPPRRLIAMNGEAGLQADTLALGWHWGHCPWQYSLKTETVIVVPQSQIAVIVAADAAQNPPERILGKIVECDNFQDARKFLTKGGEKGRQMGFLTAGTYRINTALFKVITSASASSHGMNPDQVRVYSLLPDKVGIVTTLDGLPIPPGEIAGPVIEGHDNFQNGQKFLNGGGRRGLQEQILLSGSWN